jgi:hypothetical protein
MAGAGARPLGRRRDPYAEICNHWRRDTVWGEDHSRTRHRGVLASLAHLRNALFAFLPEHFPGVSHPEIHEPLHSHPAACLPGIRST